MKKILLLLLTFILSFDVNSQSLSKEFSNQKSIEEIKKQNLTLLRLRTRVYIMFLCSDDQGKGDSFSDNLDNALMNVPGYKLFGFKGSDFWFYLYNNNYSLKEVEIKNSYTGNEIYRWSYQYTSYELKYLGENGGVLFTKVPGGIVIKSSCIGLKESNF